MKESSSQYKNEISQRSGDGEVSSLFCRKETHTHIHTNIHSTSARMYTQSFPRSLTLYPHTRAHKRNCQHLHSRKWYLNSSKILGLKVTWSVTCYWTVLSRIGACLTSSNCWFVYKLTLLLENSPLQSVCFIHCLLVQSQNLQHEHKTKVWTSHHKKLLLMNNKP